MYKLTIIMPITYNNEAKSYCGKGE